MFDLGMTNGYPDPDVERENLRHRLAFAEEQLGWCDKPWDNYEGWKEEVNRLKAELRLMGAEP